MKSRTTFGPISAMMLGGAGAGLGFDLAGMPGGKGAFMAILTGWYCLEF